VYMKIYVHHNCSSCKKALKWLKENSLEAEIINLLEKTPTKEEFELMTKSYDGNFKKLFNTSGQLYRSMEIKDKVADMGTNEVYELLRAEGMLVKRPFFLKGKNGIVGFKEELWAEFVKP